MITDVANGINLYMGPDSNITEMESIVDDGRIREAHPIWGVMMITIPFLPMMVIAPVIAMMITAEKELCTKLGWTLLAITLSLPLTAVANPVYVLFVVGVGIFRMVAPKKFNGSNAPFSAVPNRGHKKWHGRFKTAEISLESAIETCLGEFVQAHPL